MALKGKVLPLVQQWLDWDENQQTRREIEQLRQDEHWEELNRRLGPPIQFGTAGLRGQMQAGFAFMNTLTVISASQGIAEYMLASMEHKTPSDLSVLIGHDTRHHSAEFAQLAAVAFKSKGITVLLYEDYVPTPFVSFGVNHFRASVGIMVTASHNPAKDNGYKVYWSNGCQINKPVDEDIAKSIRQHEKPWPGAFEALGKPPARSARHLREEVLEAYLDRLKLVCPLPSKMQKQKPFVYTPMHGVGNFVMTRIVKEVLDRTMEIVSQQEKPDPNFPTVKFPNPEESGALDLAYDTANELGCDTIIANDPDADRLAVAERVADKSWHKFTGDQLGILLASYLIEMEKANEPLDQSVVLLSSVVSSSMLKKMVVRENSRFLHKGTLTGFKYIGNMARWWSEHGSKALFGYEEALGYMLPTVSFDKDGLAAAALYLVAREHWQSRGLTPNEKLLQIYDEIGYHESINTYFTSPQPESTKLFFTHIRDTIEVDMLKLGQLSSEKWMDVTQGLATGEWDEIFQDKGSQMITSVFVPDLEKPESKVTFTLRGSGTEPKVKLYLEASSPDKAIANAQAIEILQLIVSEWLKKFGRDLTYPRNVTSSSGRSITMD